MSSVLERAAAFEHDHTRTTVTAAGHEWTYYRGGDGPAVLLLHWPRSGNPCAPFPTAGTHCC